jgi:hypothetical protein
MPTRKFDNENNEICKKRCKEQHFWMISDELSFSYFTSKIFFCRNSINILYFEYSQVVSRQRKEASLPQRNHACATAAFGKRMAYDHPARAPVSFRPNLWRHFAGAGIDPSASSARWLR